ncbi:hypothetical protein [Obesumbacterium proteus]|uniref:hypothetical protein n=1 Tax=Obesumbacterium proteus TaxID=82983 RepID=UPI00398C27F5
MPRAVLGITCAKPMAPFPLMAPELPLLSLLITALRSPAGIPKRRSASETISPPCCGGDCSPCGCWYLVHGPSDGVSAGVL